MDTFVELPYGGPGSGFYVSQLVDHIRSSGRGYIIQGQQECRLEKHTKPHSLDVWLRRNCTDIKDTKQAVNSVIDALIATGQFTVSKDLLCPDSGRRCKGLKLLPPSDTTTDYSSHTEPYSRRNISTRSSHRASGIVVTREKLAAAGALYARLEGWQTMAALLDELRSAYPSNRDLKAVLLKASVLNQLYATNVFAIYDMARHICEVISTCPALSDRSLVQRIAEVEFGGKARRFVSFASKYAHFFIDPSVFPIVDYYAGWALAIHLGEPKSRADEWRQEYMLFCNQVDRLRERDGITVSPRELDQYLWLYGCWMGYCAEGLRSKELKELFGQPIPEILLAFGA
jgi:hypothetical protein